MTGVPCRLLRVTQSQHRSPHIMRKDTQPREQCAHPLWKIVVSFGCRHTDCIYHRKKINHKPCGMIDMSYSVVVYQKKR